MVPPSSTDSSCKVSLFRPAGVVGTDRVEESGRGSYDVPAPTGRWHSTTQDWLSCLRHNMLMTNIHVSAAARDVQGHHTCKTNEPADHKVRFCLCVTPASVSTTTEATTCVAL